MKARMTEAEVVNEALAILNEEPDDLSKFEISERVELRMTRKRLLALLAPFKDSDAPAMQGNFDKIKDFYRMRAKRCLGSDILYCHKPKLQVNDAMLALLEQLAKVFPEYKMLQLLLPYTVIPIGFKTKHYNDFIVTPDGYLVDLVKAFDDARANKDHLYVHPALRIDKLTGHPECISDLNLLLQHSPEAAQYANAIYGMSRAQYSADRKAHDANPSENSRPPKDKACEEAREALLKVINENSCHRTHAAHGEAGKQNLMKKLIKPIKGLRDLAELLGDEECVSRNEWSEFLSYIPRSELFNLIIVTPDRLNKYVATTEVEYSLNELSDLFKSKIEWPASDTAKRALCYILAFLQNDFTKDRTSEFKKFGGGFFGSWTGQVSKTEVTNITSTIMDFLVLDHDMRDIMTHLKSNNISTLSPSCQNLVNKITDAGHLCVGIAATLSQSVALASPQ